MMKLIKNKGDRAIYIGGCEKTGFKLMPGDVLYYSMDFSAMSARFYTMPDGSRTTTRPRDGEVFKHQTDPYNYDEWIWDGVKESWSRVNNSPNSRYSYSFQYTPSIPTTQEAIDAFKKSTSEYNLDMPPIPKFKKPKCDCGCAKTYGDSWPIDKHSDWCELREQEFPE